MCGRYAFTFRPSIARQRLSEQQMPVDEAPDDDDEQLRQSYNFAPGYHGLIYRASGSPDEEQDTGEQAATDSDKPGLPHERIDGRQTRETKYKLQSAKWGLIPFWTKRAPDYSSQLKTINCRDDSLIEDRGMWNTMKKNKRCIVVAEGFYEWLKKNDGKEKLPHYVKRTDGTLMCFAGLWDMVQYEGSKEKLYTYTIITTDSNEQLKFLHNRMPVLLEPGSEAMRLWLDPDNRGWSKELQRLLKPFDGALECYPVDKAVGKVGNNSPSFVIPIDSKENKKNIANFFAKQKDAEPKSSPKDSRGTTVKVEDEESNAPLPKPEGLSDEHVKIDLKEESLGGETKASSHTPKRSRDEYEVGSLEGQEASRRREEPSKSIKLESDPTDKSIDAKVITSGRRLRSATSNPTRNPSPVKAESNTKITTFFGNAS